MAYAEQPAENNLLAFTIHVWPTDDLLARSWTWCERWREAYEHVAGALGLAAATQVLQGGSFVQCQMDVATSGGRVTFAISQVGATVYITISDFSGPHSPDPNGGIGQQPVSVGGLVLGVRGSNRYFHVVVFHGVLPSIPTIDRFISPSRGDLRCNIILPPTLKSDFALAGLASSMIEPRRTQLWKNFLENRKACGFSARWDASPHDGRNNHLEKRIRIRKVFFKTKGRSRLSSKKVQK
jgi:hypothetical protein